MKEFQVPKSKTTTGPICFIGDLTLTNGDLDSDIHLGFTIGRGHIMYWMMIWHGSGNVTVIPAENPTYRRWLSGDQEITVHFK